MATQCQSRGYGFQYGASIVWDRLLHLGCEYRLSHESIKHGLKLPRHPDLTNTPGVSATGSGTWSPRDPGVPSSVPEVSSVIMLSIELLFVVLLVAGARKRLNFSSKSGISRLAVRS